MTKEEFIRYVDYLKMIFNQDIPTDKVFINNKRRGGHVDDFTILQGYDWQGICHQKVL